MSFNWIVFRTKSPRTFFSLSLPKWQATSCSQREEQDKSNSNLSHLFPVIVTPGTPHHIRQIFLLDKVSWVLLLLHLIATTSCSTWGKKLLTGDQKHNSRVYNSTGERRWGNEKRKRKYEEKIGLVRRWPSLRASESRESPPKTILSFTCSQHRGTGTTTQQIRLRDRRKTHHNSPWSRLRCRFPLLMKLRRPAPPYLNLHRPVQPHSHRVYPQSMRKLTTTWAPKMLFQLTSVPVVNVECLIVEFSNPPAHFLLLPLNWRVTQQSGYERSIYRIVKRSSKVWQDPQLNPFLFSTKSAWVFLEEQFMDFWDHLDVGKRRCYDACKCFAGCWNECGCIRWGRNFCLPFFLIEWRV